MWRVMTRTVRALLVALALPTLLSEARAETPTPAPSSATAALGRTVRQLCCGMIDWSGLDKVKSVRWIGAGPTLLDKPTADGSAMARGGRFELAGAPAELFAAGARSGVAAYYMRTPAMNLDESGILAMLRSTGLKVELARCPVSRGGMRERLWFRVSAPKGEPAIFYAGPQNGSPQTGVPGDIYALHLTPDLPLLPPQEVARFTEQCGESGRGAAPAAARSAPSQGYEAVAGLLADWLALGAAGPAPYAALEKQAAVKWRPNVFTRTSPGINTESAWDEKGTHFLNGELKTATTAMNAAAFGDARGATRFYLKDGANLPRGAVLAELRKRGFTLTTLRCGQPYTEESTDWWRITSPSGQSAVLARTVMLGTGQRQEDYALRLDNVLPPIRKGETDASVCRAL